MDTFSVDIFDPKIYEAQRRPFAEDASLPDW